MEKNSIPENVETIHLIAVCGTAMAALAAMLKDQGFDVTGSDHHVYPPMSTFLAEKGIEIMDGFSGEHIAFAPDLVVVGNTVTRDNPEAVRLKEMELHFCSMPQAINHFIAAGKKPLLVTGTHGKTTTSSILAWVLSAAGFDPSFMIGGILKNFSSNYRLGAGDYMVIEGDEYDTAFFDKGAKFFHYRPHAVVLTGVEFDHADIFKDMSHVYRTFDAFVSGISSKSTLVAFDGDENVTNLVQERSCQTLQYGRRATSPWRIGTVRIDPPWTEFEVLKDSRTFATFRTRLVGEHNLFNALSVVAVADSLGVAAGKIANALETFEGVKRRQEVRGEKRGVTVMDDFAHHPTAVKETLRAVKPFYPDGRLIAVFEPRTNSSMRDVFQNVYSLSFDAADLVCIREASLLHKIPAGERFSSERLVQDLKARGKDAYFFKDTNTIIDFVTQNASSGDVILVMSNGGFDNIHERLLQSL